MADLLTTATIETAAGRVRFADAGAGDVPLIFVHGYPDNLQIWTKVFAQLQHDHRVLAFDWPSLGHSGPASEPGATPFHLGRALLALLDALRIEAAVPVGFDMGGHAVVAAVHKEPERFAGLVLSNFLAFGNLKTSFDITLMRRLGLNRVFLGSAGRLVFTRAERSFLARNHQLQPDVRRDMWTAFQQESVRAHLIKMCAGYQACLPRVSRLYPQVDLPSLVLWADKDSHFPLDQATALQQALPDSELKVLTGNRHWFMWESPDLVAEHLRAFTAKLAISR